ncbi:class I SAM-dependent methyltransferase [Aquabacterium sp.]|uniref:class I SAM-dependent methyltransferase n=1 Tax=Aquabacterium sp. TaxID=1872578 RepID=UPI002E303315|nr:class I SAM-dependent methyltransferase [Aquabacterium sp.]HEX5311731.1 class I SAM-dependent methyltransferase [Aquabacterium sp.]
MNLSDRFFLRQAERRLAALPLPCAVQLPGGLRIGASQPMLQLMVRDVRTLMHLAQGVIGRLAEDYVEGSLQIEGQLRDLMTIAPALLGIDPTQVPSTWRHRAWQNTRLAIRSFGSHSRDRDARQVQQHYDVSDDFYALWLDPRRIYSCAYFSEPTMTLSQAQESKLDHICKKLMLSPRDRFIDIGAGWGGLLLWAAEHYEVNATGITLSKNQYAYVNRLIDARKLQGRVRMLLQDYRDIDESHPFDKVASIGMCEHVGAKNLTAYFAKIRRILRPGGLLLNQAITSGSTEAAQLGGGLGDFIEKYIFPGGQLVHVSVMLAAMGKSKLEAVDAECLRPHYARTLWHWADALDAHLDQARRVLGARSESVIRAYRLYLAGSAMGFEQGWLSLFQVLGVREDDNRACAYPFNRSYMYLSAEGHDLGPPP